MHADGAGGNGFARLAAAGKESFVAGPACRTHARSACIGVHLRLNFLLPAGVVSATVVQRIVRLEAGLIGDAKPVGEGVSELRVDYGPGYRVYFVQRGQVLTILLCGADKRSRRRDSACAESLAAELENQ